MPRGAVSEDCFVVSEDPGRLGILFAERVVSLVRSRIGLKRFAWLTRAGGEFRLNVSPERLPIATKEKS